MTRGKVYLYIPYTRTVRPCRLNFDDICSWSWGFGGTGALGHGGDRDHALPKLVGNDQLQMKPNRLGQAKVRSISCGPAHTIAECADGRVFAWGCGDNGRLCLDDVHDRALPVCILNGHSGDANHGIRKAFQSTADRCEV